MHIMGIFALAMPIGTQWFGSELVRFAARGKLTFVEIVGAGFPVGIAITSVASLVLNVIFRCTFIHFSLVTAMLYFFAAVFHKVNKRRVLKSPHVSQFLTFAFILALGFSWRISTFTMPEKKTIFESSKNTMALEISLIASFARGCNKKRGFVTGIRNPLVSHTILTSDYLPTIYIAILKAGGLSIRYGIIIVTMWLIMSILILQFAYTTRHAKSDLAAALSAALVLLVGGFGFTHYVEKGPYRSTDCDFITNVQTKNPVVWRHPLLHVFIPSRVALLCLALSLVAYICLEAGNLPAAITICFTMILLRPQTGFVLFIVVAFYRIKEIGKRAIFLPFGIILAFTLGLRISMTGPAWAKSQSPFPLCKYIFDTLGIIGIMIPVGIYMFPYRTTTALAIFIGVSFISLQSDQANNAASLLCTVVPILVATSAIAMVELAASAQSEELRGVLVMCVLLLSLSGALSSLAGLYKLSKLRVTVWEDDETEAAEWAVKNTKRNAVFLSLGMAWNPIVTRAGRMEYTVPKEMLPFVPVKRDSPISNFTKTGNFEGFEYAIAEIDTSHGSTLMRIISKGAQEIYRNEKYIIISKK